MTNRLFVSLNIKATEPVQNRSTTSQRQSEHGLPAPCGQCDAPTIASGVPGDVATDDAGAQRRILPAVVFDDADFNLPLANAKRLHLTAPTETCETGQSHLLRLFGSTVRLAGICLARRPISARMALPDNRWSYLLQQWTQMLCVDSAYQQAMDNLQVILGGEKFSVDTAEKVNGQMGRVAGAYLGDLPKPAADSESRLMVA